METTSKQPHSAPPPLQWRCSFLAVWHPLIRSPQAMPRSVQMRRHGGSDAHRWTLHSSHKCTRNSERASECRQRTHRDRQTEGQRGRDMQCLHIQMCVAWRVDTLMTPARPFQAAFVPSTKSSSSRWYVWCVSQRQTSPPLPPSLCVCGAV